jgi:hypothetical protein
MKKTDLWSILPALLLLPLLIILVHRPANAQFQSVKTGDVELLYYHFGHEYLINHTIRSFTNSLDFHKRTFGYRTDEHVTLIMQDFGDYGNAGASAVPGNAILMGIAPFHYAFETNPANERINVLMNHELVHIVALDMSTSTDRFFRKAFSGKVNPEKEDPISLFYAYMTTPRRFSPRWYHEGIAEFMTTWMSGGIGRVMGPYDEMRFRTMVRDNRRIYDAVGLESEGTTTDFEVGSNSYMYGTRFMSYLAVTYSPQHIIDWASRSNGSKRYFSADFKKVFGTSLHTEWSNWIDYERRWQEANLARIRRNPVTETTPLAKRPLGGVSRPVYDNQTGLIYTAVAKPGEISHIAEVNPATGSMRRVVDIESPALHFVSSLAFDPENRTIFYTDNNNSWRHLMAHNLNTGKTSPLIREVRTGDLVFNPADRSIWGVRHYHGIVSLVRIPYPYTEWNRIRSMPYGEDIFDIDISPDGKQLSAAIADVSGNQKLVMMSVDSLMAGQFSYEEIYDFEVSSPAAFVFSPDGRYLFGSTYYTGVSNIVRYDIEQKEVRWLTNAETGLFRPVPYSADSLLAFEYTGDGFFPVRIENKPAERVSAIRFLGQEVVERHPVVTEWMLRPPAPGTLNPDSLIISRGDYHAGKRLSLIAAYPIVHGYKDYVAGGVRLDFSDPLRLQKMNITAGWSPHPGLDTDEQFHASWLYEMSSMRFFASYNASDFYDLFGPTKTSRKGYSVGMGYKKSLIYSPPRIMDMDVSLSYYGGLERLPEFQNITTSFGQFFSLSTMLSYQRTLHSLGAVDHEKGFRWQLGTFTNTIAENVGDQRIVFPRVFQNLDYGIALPIKHSSVWLRSSVGYSFSPVREPLGNFYFGGFGNNWIDYRANRRYRSYHTFPGVDLNGIGGTNFTRLLVEWVTPPVRFRRAGVTSLYANWMQLSLFSTGIITNLDKPVWITSTVTGENGTETERVRQQNRFYNAGAQVDMRISLFSIMDATLSFGYAMAWDYDVKSFSSDEFMVSLKIFR